MSFFITCLGTCEVSAQRQQCVYLLSVILPAWLCVPPSSSPAPGSTQAFLDFQVCPGVTSAFSHTLFSGGKKYSNQVKVSVLPCRNTQLQVKVGNYLNKSVISRKYWYKNNNNMLNMQNVPFQVFKIVNVFVVTLRHCKN